MKREPTYKEIFVRAAWIFTHVFLVTLAFTIDVKVRADSVIENQVGRVEIEKNGDLVQVQKMGKVGEPFGLQTFGRSGAKFTVNSIFVGADERTLVFLPDVPRVELSWGAILVSAPTKDKTWLTVRTPQGDVTTPGGEFVVSSKDGRTSVSVISGKVEIKDRSMGEPLMIRAGYASWIGGLLATGVHARGRLEAIDFENVMNQIRRLGNYTFEEVQARYDRLHPLWKEAVDDVAQQTQDQVTGDMKLLDDIREDDAKREARHKKQQSRLRKMYFRKTLMDDDPDVTGENREAPSESPRNLSSLSR